MISRSVAQIATASMRTSTSAFFGTGTGFCFKVRWPGSPSTHAFMVSGIGKSGLVFTPVGAYIGSPLGMAGKLGAAELGFGPRGGHVSLNASPWRSAHSRVEGHNQSRSEERRVGKGLKARW